MVKIYDELVDENGFVIGDRTRLFIRHNDVDEEGNIITYVSGTSNIINAPGTQFIVDGNIISQIDKLKMVEGRLIEKPGKKVQERIKTPEEIKVEQMEREIAALKQKSINEIKPAE